jgi:hypothetical protein
VELLALVADQPSLIATAEADRAFSLLTTGALRDIYNAARGGQSVLELVSVQLPAPTAQLVLSGKYAGAKDPVVQLAAITRELERRTELLAPAELQKRLAAAHRSGDRETARRLALLAEARRKGDGELAAQLASEMLSNRKQAD